MTARRGTLLSGLALLSLWVPVSTSWANDNPALGIGEPNTPWNPPCPGCPCSGLTCDPCGGSGSPVILNNGKLYQLYSDLQFGLEKIPFNHTRMYFSDEFYVGLFGKGFHSSLDMMSIGTERGGPANEVVVIRWPDGQRSRFTRQPNGTYAFSLGRFEELVAVPGGFELSRKDGTLYVFDDQTRLLRIEDRAGNAVTYSYDAEGRPVRVTLPGARNIDVTYNARGFVDTMSDFAGRTISYGYNAEDFLVSYTDAEQHTWTYEYDNGRLARVIDPLGQMPLSVTYDAQGRVSRVVDDEGDFTYTYVNATQTTKKDNVTNAVWTFVFDSQGRITEERNPLNQSTRYLYDSRYNLIRLTDGAGRVTNMTYDDRGNLLSRTDPLNFTTNYTYDPMCDLVDTITNPRGVITKHVYDAECQLLRIHRAFGTAEVATTVFGRDAAGNVTSVTSPTGGVSTMQYDAFGNMIRSIDGLLRETQFTYDSLGRLTERRDPTGSVLVRTYDDLDHVIREVNALGEETNYVYDAAGNLIETRDPLGRVTRTGYDAYHRPSSITLAGGGVTSFTRASFGQLLTTTDALGNVVTTVYDAAMRVVGAQLPMAATVSAVVDAAGVPTTVTDAAGRVTTEVFSAKTELLSIKDGLNNTSAYLYDSVGNSTRRTDALLRATTYTYNLQNALTRIDYPGGVNVVITRDLMNRITRVIGPNFDYAYDRDAEGQLTRVRDITNGRIYTYVYDGVGRVTRKTDSGGVVTDYTYDLAGRLTEVRENGAAQQTNTCDAAGRLTQSVAGNGLTTVYTYDLDGNVATQVTTKGAQVQSSLTQEYDLLGRNTRTVQSVRDFSGTVNTTIARYTYDALGRLTSETRLDENESLTLYSRVWEYDKTGNRTSQTTEDGTVTTYAYDAAGRLTAETTTPAGGSPVSITYTYDANGNLTREQRGTEIVNYTYDFENRLTGVQTPTQTVTHVLAPDGKRLRTTVGTDTTVFQYDGLNIDREIRPDGTTVKYTLGRHIDALIAKREDAGALQYYVMGPVNSVLQLTDAGGNVLNSYDFTAFGEDVDVQETAFNPFQFAGRRKQTESGLYYFREREYDAGSGRFLSLDPMESYASRSVPFGVLGEVDGDTPVSPLFRARTAISSASMPFSPSRYIYVGNDPRNHLDPTGEVLVWNPISGSALSGCAMSGCVISGCAGSVCVGSGCGGSGCGISGCGGSGCGGSGCGASGCAGSACLLSGCFASACGGSVCVGTACVGSGCIGSYCYGSVCEQSGCGWSACLEGSACAASACGGSSGCGTITTCTASVCGGQGASICFGDSGCAGPSNCSNSGCSNSGCSACPCNS